MSSRRCGYQVDCNRDMFGLCAVCLLGGVDIIFTVTGTYLAYVFCLPGESILLLSQGRVWSSCCVPSGVRDHAAGYVDNNPSEE